MNTPIYNKLKELDSEKRIPFHMPGHKRTDFGAFFGIEKTLMMRWLMLILWMQKNCGNTFQTQKNIS